MVHVRSQDRHRHIVNVLMTFASVPMIRPLQKGQAVGRSIVLPSRRSNIAFALRSSAAKNHPAEPNGASNRRGSGHHRMAPWMLSDIVCVERFQ